MINDVIEITLNEKKYRARLDMGAIAEAQWNLKQVKENITVVEMFDLVKKENYKVINNLIIESIRRCHPQLDSRQILEDMKLHEKNSIVLQVFELMKASLPAGDDDKKKKSGIVNPYRKVEDWDMNEMEYIWYSILKRIDDFYSITPKYYFKQLDAHKKFNGLDKEDSKREVVNETSFG